MAEHEPDFDARGVPLCAYSDCKQYDGKRCRLLGFRPCAICEPAVVEMAEKLAPPAAREGGDDAG